MNFRCAVIEDHFHMNEQLQYIASKSDFVVDFFLNGNGFLKENDFDFACFLVDLNMPGIDGVEIVSSIREKNKFATILIISAETESQRIKDGLAAGADDFIGKPFAFDQLELKLKNARNKYAAIHSVNLNLGIKFIEEAKVLVADGKQISLTETEFNLAKILYSNSDKVVRRVDLEKSLSLDSVARSLDVILHSLRTKIKNTKIQIKNSRGVGYIWIK